MRPEILSFHFHVSTHNIYWIWWIAWAQLNQAISTYQVIIRLWGVNLVALCAKAAVMIWRRVLGILGQTANSLIPLSRLLQCDKFIQKVFDVIGDIFGACLIIAIIWVIFDRGLNWLIVMISARLAASLSHLNFVTQRLSRGLSQYHLRLLDAVLWRQGCLVIDCASPS